MGRTSSVVKDRYNAKAYDDIRIRVPKGRKSTVEAVAAQQGESVNGLVNGLLRGAAGLTEDEWKRTGETPTGSEAGE